MDREEELRAIAEFAARRGVTRLPSQKPGEGVERILASLKETRRKMRNASAAHRIMRRAMSRRKRK